VVWDTGSDWTIVESHECDSCYTPVYDHATETSFSVIADTEGERNYGSTWTSGYEAFDMVCITNSIGSCATDFQWFVVTE